MTSGLCDQLLPLGMMLARTIVLSMYQNFISFWPNSIPLFGWTKFCPSLCCRWTPGCFLILVTVNNPAASIGAQAFCGHSSSSRGPVPGRGTVCEHLRGCQTVFQSGWTTSFSRYVFWIFFFINIVVTTNYPFAKKIKLPGETII